jgi:hypothetical protein
MLFEGAHSIHTIGMRFAIQVVLLDRDYRVVRTRIVAPGRMVHERRARHVLELGIDERLEVGAVLSPGDRAPRTTRGAPGTGRRART